jgi:haloalkane dehalogenase
MEQPLTPLPDYPFRANYINILGLKMHYVDEGPRDAAPLLLLHGVPSWSYIYRNMISPLAGNGIRVIAPDLIGFGKSEKLISSDSHTYQRHVEWMAEFVRLLGLNQITLFGQDWGAIIGMHLVAELPDRFRGLVLSNGVVLTGEEKLPPVFLFWKYFARYSPWLPVGWIISLGCRRKLSREEKWAYQVPFSNRKEKAGIRTMPSQVPTIMGSPNGSFGREAWKELEHWEKPVLCLFSTGDPFTRGGERLILDRIPGAKGQNHKQLPGGHFIQEDAGEELVSEICNFILGLPENAG